MNLFCACFQAWVGEGGMPSKCYDMILRCSPIVDENVSKLMFQEFNWNKK